MTEENTPPEGGSFTPPSSQDELDRIVSKRLERERSKFADYDDLKAKATQFDQLSEQNKTELQKLQDELAERDARLSDLPKQARTQAIRFASQATAAGFLDPEDALLNLADVDLSDSDAVKTALEDLAERKPHLVRQDRKKPPTRPKPAKGEPSDDPTGGLTGKERAAAALRQMRG
jgi:DNA repair exonuclease SbcCD ATPase subunit